MRDDDDATDEPLAGKFLACARRVLEPERTEAAIVMLRSMERLADARTLTECMVAERAS